MNIYQENGYLNFEKLYKDKNPFIFCIGARGVGKTFGALQYCYLNKLKFIYLRTSAEQVKKLSNESMNPFKALNSNMGIDVRINTKNTGGNTQFLSFTKTINESGDQVEEKEIIGYLMALSTFSNFRGFDMSDIDIIIYDEFIPEAHERPLKNQATILLNAYETANRNRELNGAEPIKLICLSNSNTIFNDIFLYLKITKRVYDMMKKRKMYYFDDSRKMSIYTLYDSPISKRKEDTALYRLTAGTEFNEMALDNQFQIENENLIKSMNIFGFNPVTRIGELFIYSNADNIYYASTFAKGVFPYQYEFIENQIILFRRNHFNIYSAFLDNRLFFENIYCMELFNMLY